MYYIYLNNSNYPNPIVKNKKTTMKTTQPSSLYNSDNPVNKQKKETSDVDTNKKTPYLKDILSGTKKLFNSESKLPDLNADRLAALRYIKDSALIKHIYAGKMSC